MYNFRYLCLTLGLDEADAQKTDSSSSKINCFKGISLLPYILHTTVLALFGVFCIRVQVCITHTLY